MEIWPYVAAGIAVLTFVFGVGRWTMGVDADRKALREFMQRLEDKLDKIFDRLPVQTVSGSSPIQLTDLGEEISASLGADGIVEDLVSDLREKTEGKGAYDIQEICTAFFRDEYAPSPDTEARIKESAYLNGVDRDQVMMVLAVVLRDRLLRPTDETC